MLVAEACLANHVAGRVVAIYAAWRVRTVRRRRVVDIEIVALALDESAITVEVLVSNAEAGVSHIVLLGWSGQLARISERFNGDPSVARLPQQAEHPGSLSVASGGSGFEGGQ